MRRPVALAAHETPTTTFLTGLAMGESARWHDGRFWCSYWVAGGGKDGRTLFMVVDH